MSKGLSHAEGAGGKIETSRWETIATDYQLKTHEGYKPEALHLRSEGEFAAGREGSRTPTLARPPAWTELPDGQVLACVEDMALFDKCPNQWGRHRDVETAQKMLCTQCPVRELCLEDAMAMEGNLSTRARHFVRGGLTPKERFALYRKGESSTSHLGKPAPNVDVA